MLAQYLALSFAAGFLTGWVLGWLWSRPRTLEALHLYQRERYKAHRLRIAAKARLDEQRKILRDLNK